MVPRSLGTLLTQFEERSRIEFDDLGWEVFSEKVADFYSTLHKGARRECAARSQDEAILIYSMQDVERATVRLDMERFFARKRRRGFFQAGAMIGSLLTGIFGNWAFSDISGVEPSMLPWCFLIVSIVATAALYHIQALKEIAP
jgi:hypothetical protein